MPESKDERATELVASIDYLHETFALGLMRTLILMNEAARDASRRRVTLAMMKQVQEFGAKLGIESHCAEQEGRNEAATVELLEQEKSKGFPLHNGLTTIGMWAALEAYLDDLIADCIFWRPDFLEVRALNSIKGSLYEFAGLRLSEQSRHLVERLLSEQTKKVAAARYEEVMIKLGIGGSVPDKNLLRILNEFYAVRNLFAHRGGHVDKRFREACPQFDVELGDEFLLSQGMVLAYMAAASKYASIVAKRVLDRLGATNDRVEAMLKGSTAVAKDLEQQSPSGPKRRARVQRSKRKKTAE